MKILYTKHNSERNPKFQLSTIIYEENGERFVKKEALTVEAEDHLMQMKKNYTLLSNTILNPKIKLAKIIDEGKNFLVFEFIEGESLEQRYSDALSVNSLEATKIIDAYIKLIKTDFKTTVFDAKNTNTDLMKDLFGDNNTLEVFNDKLAFNTISNIDLIFSNIIFKNDAIYILDYEWVYPVGLPIDYIIYRALSILPNRSEEMYKDHNIEHSDCQIMEKYFLEHYVMHNGFYFYKEHYKKQFTAPMAHIQALEKQVNGKETHITELAERILQYNNAIVQKDKDIESINKELSSAHSTIEKLQNMSILQMVKKLIKKTIKLFIPMTILKKLKNNEQSIIEQSGLFDDDYYLKTYTDVKDLGIDPLKHFINYGWKEDRNPSNKFDLMFYVAYYPDIKESTQNPLLHYIKYGKNENRFATIDELHSYNMTHITMTDKDINNLKNFKQNPLISIVMPVYNIDPKWLKRAIDSIENQWYSNWELCIADDKSTNEKTVHYLKSLNHPKIKITYLEKNQNISAATNMALTSANGEYIALMDNDDELTPNALYEIVSAINTYKADFIYSDEDFIDSDGRYINPHYKPDFSPDLLLSHNYITHLSCFKSSLLKEVGNFNSKYDGAQDFDLFLRLTEKAKNIYHIPKILYHWRMLETSTSANSKAKPEALQRGKDLINDTLKRRNIQAETMLTDMDHYFKVKYTIQNNPLVSIVIPFKDKPELLDMCVNSILEKTSYQNYEIIGISNNSEEKETFNCMKALEAKDNRVKFYEYNVPFNYSKINNYAVNNYTRGEHILLLNNDIEVINEEWLESMLEHSQRVEVGCVGAKLYYPNDTVQHAGIIMGLGGYAGHSHKGVPRESHGYFNRLNTTQNVSAVTGACLMVKKSIYKKLEGLNEIDFKVAYNDVDFCLRVGELGYLNLFTPYAELYHHESISRGYEESPEKIARFQREKDALSQRHKEILENGDPYYNPNLTHAKEDFSLCIEKL